MKLLPSSVIPFGIHRDKLLGDVKLSELKEMVRTFNLKKRRINFKSPLQMSIWMIRLEEYVEIMDLLVTTEKKNKGSMARKTNLDD